MEQSLCKCNSQQCCCGLSPCVIPVLSLHAEVVDVGVPYNKKEKKKTD